MVRLGFQPLLSSVKVLYFPLKSDILKRLEKKIPNFPLDEVPNLLVQLKKYEAESKVIELDATKPTSELLNIVLEVLNEHNN